MKDYKQTLNLPKTQFPMKANLAQREPGFLAFWKEINLYDQLRALGKHRKKYILHDGPPYANGQIHIGHAVNKILKDIVVKSKTLSGYDAPFVPGWDCHGLPIELNVEKKAAAKKLSPKAFRKACREYAESQIQLQKEAFERLGVLGDWDHPYLTMNFSYEAGVIRALAEMMSHGHLQQGQKPVHWCVDCQSALAEAEVEYKNKTSKAIDVAFRVENPWVLNQCFHLSEAVLDAQSAVILPIWTTTPWTLPANEAVAVGEKLDYTLFRTEAGQYFILATELSGEIFSRYDIGQYTAIATTQGQSLSQIILKHPLLEKQVPVVTGHHVTLEAGTGAVHTAPAHGVDDYEVGRQNHLPMVQLVDHRGCYVAQAELFPGAHVHKVNNEVVTLLKDRHQLLSVKDLEHSYPHCWRHKTPLIFRATPQWFIGMDQQHLRQNTLKAIQQCEWIPHWGQSRISTMIANRPDWCISRQRMWGTPIPLFIHKETQTPHPESVSLMKQVANLVEKEGIDAWFDLSMQDLLGKEAEDYYKLTDSLDVWFDSGVSHSCVLKQRPELAFPADLYWEGSDQHRGWFQSSILTSMAMSQAAPYKAVLTHGYVVDAKGHKMSKSLGNVIDPLGVIKSLGADILRLWVASTDYRGEMSVSQDIIAQAGEMYRRIRNTARFILSNLWDFDPNTEQNIDLWDIDHWAIQETNRLTYAIKEAYDAFQFHGVCKKIHHFCNEDLGGFYLDLLKDRLYTLPANSAGRRSAQKALYHLIHALTAWIAPILSFTAEEIWQCLKEKDSHQAASVFLSQFPETKTSDLSEGREWHWLKAVKSEVNQLLERYRNEGKIGSSLEAVVTLYCHDEGEYPLYSFLSALNQEEAKNMNQGLRFTLITSDVQVFPADSQDVKGLVTAIPNLRVSVDVSTEPKCERCWHHRQDVGQSVEYPATCGRCVENLSTSGETSASDTDFLMILGKE